MNDEIKYGVEPFDGSNFTLWARRIESIFAAKNLDIYLKQEADAAKADEVAASKKAYALMLSFLSNKVLVSLAEESTCAMIFSKLRAIYLREGAVSQILVRKRLASLKKKKETTMQEHFDEVSALVNQLKSCGVKVNDMDIIVYLLMSLPAEYDSSKSAIENQPSENLTLEFVYGRLLDAEALMKDRRTSESKVTRSESSTDAAFSTRINKTCYKCHKKGHISKFCKTSVTCHRCGKSGHLKRNCWLSCKTNQSREETAAITFVVGEPEFRKFVVDSGASAHMCSQRNWFEELKPSSGTVSCADKSSQLEVSGIGTVRGTLENKQEIILKDVLYIPELNGNLMSVKQIQNAGFSVTFKNDEAVVKKGSTNFVLCKLSSKGQYICDLLPIVSNSLLAETGEAELWHRRLGHSGNHALKKLGLPTTDSFCENCVLSKQPSDPFGKGNRKREQFAMRMIHSDLCGAVEPMTASGERYVLTFVDDYSRFCEVRLIKNKSDIALEFKKFLKMNDSINRIRCDNAPEYVSGELRRVADSMGVTIDPCPPHTPQLNGVAERINKTLFEKARALLYDSKLPKNCWGYAIQVAAYLHNRIPSSSIGDVTPFELKYSRKPDMSQIKLFGCDVYVRVPDALRKKLDPKSKRMIFVGYSNMGYRVMDPITGRVTVSRNVRFNEMKVIVDDSNISPNTEQDRSDNDSGEEEVKEEKEDDVLDEPESREEHSTLRRSQRIKRFPVRYEAHEVMFATHETLTFDEIQDLPVIEQANWKNAMNDEMHSMEVNRVWDLVELPESGKQPITCKWVFKKKRDGKYKARLVARGFMQKEGMDYNETYSPVISVSSLRLVLVAILQENLHAYAMDVKTAFLNGDLNETIYMMQPQGYDDGSGKVCKLYKSLYGLKQAPRQWFHKFLEFMDKINFIQCESDPCIFIRTTDEKKIIICLYVDDLLIAGSSISDVQTVIHLLKDRFEMSKSEPLTEFLGIQLHFTPTELSLDQSDYILKLLKSFNMSDCKPCSTPLEPKSTAADFANGSNFEGPYRELVGSLMYLAITSRPDILFSVNCLSQLQEKPTITAWNALKRILRYLKGTVNIKIVYKKSDISNNRSVNNSNNLCMYVDADWAANSNDRKSITGYVLMFYNCPILWCCKKQNSISLSSTEAEIVAMCKSLQDMLVYKNILDKLCVVNNAIIFEDNQSAINSVSNENVCARLKHLDVKLKFIRETLMKNNITVEYLCTEFQIADMFTKCLSKCKFQKLLNLCSMM